MADTVDFKISHMLTLLDDRLKYLNDEEKALNDKAQKNLEAITIILGIFGAFHIAQEHRAIQTLIGFIFIVYLLVIFLSGYVIFATKKWRLPIDITEPNVRDLLSKNDDEYVESIRLSYIDAITYNENILIVRNRIVRVCLVLVVLDIALIILAVGVG